MNTKELIENACRHSNYLKELLNAEEAIKKELQKYVVKEFCKADVVYFLKKLPCKSKEYLDSVLRQARKVFYATIIVRDINGLAKLQESFNCNTTLAEIFLQYAHNFHAKALVKRYGEPISEQGKIQQLIIVGMGKLGGHELNPSSDIDIIFTYPESGQTRGKESISNQDFFTLLAKDIIASFSDYSADGILFRVDLRLRPFGSDGLLVFSLESLESYFESHGLDWERYAWLKARVVVGPEDALDKIVSPFVYRQYLDFNVFESLRQLKTKINTDMSKKINAGDIKIGPGGIRTAEFIVQSQQIVWGGKDSELRAKTFLQALQDLASKNILKKHTQAIKAAYCFMRNLEHRLQYMDDKQTHKLPDDETERHRIAESMGFVSWKQFITKLNYYQSSLETIFTSLFQDAMLSKSNGTTSSNAWLSEADHENVMIELTQLSFQNATEVAQYLQNFKQASSYRTLTPISKARFDHLAPLVINLAASVNEPDRTLVSFFNFLAKIARRSSYLSLLRENSNVLKLMIQITSFDPHIIDKVAENPVIIDDLFNTADFLKTVDLTAETKHLRLKLKRNTSNLERQMDELRQFKNSIIFKLAVQEIMGIFPVENISDALSELADLMVAEILKLVWSQVFPKQAYPPLAVIAYGKLGGKEMGYLSDLDLVFLYEDSKAYSSDQYLKLIQRFNSWTTSLTGAGFLYDIDLRLRPDGGSGLLVTSWDAFKEYQSERALAWEQQAMCKARFSSGQASLKNKFDTLRKKILCQARNKLELKAEVIHMRERIYRNKTPKSETFDLKHSHGGMVEIEFLTQYFILAYSAKYAELTANIGNIALLQLLAKLNLLTEQDARTLVEAYRFYRSLQHRQGITPESPGKVSNADVGNTPKKIQQIWKKFCQKDFL